MHQTEHASDEQLSAYALGALDPGDYQRVALHLDGCGQCRSQLAAYASIAEGLLYAPEAKKAPNTVRNRLRRRIQNRVRDNNWIRMLRTAPVAFGALAIGLVVILAVNAGLLIQAREALERQVATLAQQQASLTAAAIASYPTSKVAVMEQEGLRGTFVYDPEIPVGVAYLWGLEPPGSDQAYQTWLVDPDGERVSGGLLIFGQDADFAWLRVEAPVPLSEFVSLGITLEPSGGSDAPTGPRIIGTDL